MADLTFSPDEQRALEGLLKDIDAAREAAGFHPILVRVLELCVDDEGKPWRATLEPERVTLVEQMVDECAQNGSLRHAVFDLLRVSTWLDHVQKAGMPAYQLFKLANDTVIRFKLHKAPDERDPSAQKAVGKGDKLAAPKLGEKAPAGSVTVDKISPKRRI